MIEDTPMVNLPLWELVKSTTYGRYLVCVSHYEKVVMDYQKNKAIPGIRKSRHEAEFIASLMGLFIDLAPKIYYPKKKEYKQLAELNAYMTPDGESLEYGEAIHYFGLLRNLMEDLGLTRTERKSETDSQRFVKGVTH